MSEDKPSKTNGVVPDPMQRLASFKAPRDLTLGGVKTSKKIFTPNLNVTRNKNKGSSTKQNNQKKDDKDKRDRKNDKDRNIKNGPNIIKSAGVFSEGLANLERHSNRTYYGRDSDPVQTMQRPTIRVKDFVKIDKELEEQKIKSITGETGNIEEDSDCEDFNVLDKDAPIKLPIDIGGCYQVKPKMKQELLIKKEPDDPECVSDLDQKPTDVKEIFEDTDVANLLRSNQPTLMLLQFPDTLPFRGGKMEDEGPRRNFSHDEPSTSQEEVKTEKTTNNRCQLSDLEEGRIGKLRLHRSGRVSLVLGDTPFDVSMGIKVSFQQEVVSVATDETSRSANLIALGSLQHQLTLIPNWEALLADMSI